MGPAFCQHTWENANLIALNLTTGVWGEGSGLLSSPACVRMSLVEAGEEKEHTVDIF